MRWTLLLAPLLLTAGCMGIADDEAPGEEAQPQAADTNNSTATEEAFEFTETTHSGAITGWGTPVARGNTPDSDTVLEVDVGEDAVEIGFIVAPEGGPVQMNIASPSCDPNTGCEEIVQAEDQADADWNTTDPEAGTWTLRFFYGETGAGEVDWTLDHLAKIPAE